MAHEAPEAREPVRRADGPRQSDDADDEEDGQGGEAHPQAAGADQGVEDEEQRSGLCVAALPEGGFEVEAHGRQADEAEHQGRAHRAFEAVERVVPEGGGDIRQASVREGRERAGARGQHPQGREVRLLDDLGIHLGTDARVGQGDGEDAGEGREAEDLHQQQRPEQLVHRAQARADEAHAPRLGEGNGEDEAGARPQRDPEDGEGDVETTLHSSTDRKSGWIRPSSRRWRSAQG